MYSDAGARGATDAAAQAHVSEVRETAAEGEEATGEPGAAKPVGAEERAEPPAGGDAGTRDMQAPSEAQEDVAGDCHYGPPLNVGCGVVLWLCIVDAALPQPAAHRSIKSHTLSSL